jgi:hypothetical protein
VRAPSAKLSCIVMLLVIIVLTVGFRVFSGNSDVYLGTISDSAYVDVPDRLYAPDKIVDVDSHSQAQFVVTCSFIRALPVDPIVGPSLVHEHAFFGNRAVGVLPKADLSNSTTSCAVPTDTASYWVPTLRKDSVSIYPDHLVAYYRKGIDVTTNSIQPYPSNMFMLAGSDTVANKSSFWKCSGNSATHSSVPKCPQGSSVTMVVVFPDCWDALNSDSYGHREHVRYSRNGVCPSTHPAYIPQLIVKIVYAQYPQDDLSLYGLSSQTAAPHADFLNLWKQEELVKLVNTCLVRNQVCPVH